MLREININSYMNENQKVGGIDFVKKILNGLSFTTKDQIINSIEREDIKLAKKLKENSASIKDILNIQINDIKKVMDKIALKELSIFLKYCDFDVKEKIFNSLSKNRKELLIKEIDYIDRVKKADYNTVVTQILNRISTLEKNREINVIRNRDEYIW